MTKVQWSRAVLVYDSSSRLSHLLGDLRQRVDPAHDDGPALYVAIRLDPWLWFVEDASRIARSLDFAELEEICARTDYTAQISDATGALIQHLVFASALRSGTPPALLTVQAHTRYAVVLDENDSLLWVGERTDVTLPGSSEPVTESGRPPVSWPAPPAEPSSPIPPIPRSAPPPRMEPEATSPDDALASTAPPMPGAPPEPAATTAPSSERYLQGDLFRKSDSAWLAAEPRLVRRETYRLDVFIGPPGMGAIQASAAFRDDLLDWAKKDAYQLQIVFNEIGVTGPAQTGWIELKRHGVSSSHSFEFVPQATALFQGRISVLHEGRVLQTAVIEAEVVESIDAARGAGSGARPAVEMIVRHDLASLDERRPFDVSLILNHAATGSAAMTAASRESAYVASLDDLQGQLAAISELLAELGTNSKRHTKGLTTKENAAWLVRLASQGNFLYRKLVLDYIDQSPTAAALRSAKTMQIVSARPDAVVPLEFVYEYPPPAKGAPVCPNARKALEDGACPEQCRPTDSPAQCVCPMGFWGLDRVIERHVHDARLGAAAAITGSEPTADRKELDTRGSTFLAASEQVPKSDQKALAERIRKAWKGEVSVATSWTGWPAEVKAKSPGLFVLLPHTTGKGDTIALEIDGHTLECRYINKGYVCPEGTPSPPIVLLLGCDTASVADRNAYTSNIAVFRQAGSAIVIGSTAALIWGVDAAKVAGEIMQALGDAVAQSSNSIGGLLLTAKRRSVHDSQLMAISLAAFGDADWRIKGH